MTLIKVGNSEKMRIQPCRYVPQNDKVTRVTLTQSGQTENTVAA